MIAKEAYLASYLSPSTPVFMHIRSIIGSMVLKKATKPIKNELLQLVNANGWEAEKFMFVCLLQHIDLKEIKEKGTLQKVTLLANLLGDMCGRENFLFYFPEALGMVTKNPAEYLQALIKYLKLQLQTQIIMALSMYLSDNQQLSRQGEGLLKTKLNEYYHLGKPIEFPPKALEELLFQIGRNPQLLQQMQEQYQYLLQTSSPERAPQSKCYHYLNDNYKVYSYEPPNISKTNELIKKSELLRDLGPYCTFNMESLKIVLNELGQLTEEDVFQCLMLMSEDNVYVGDSLDRFMTDLMVTNKKSLKAEEWRKFYQNQDLTEKRMQAAWSIDSFLTYAVQNVPNLKWTSVMGYFDRLDLEITSHEAFLNMFKYFQKAKKQGPKFKTPEILFFKKWNHPRSQLKFLLQIFKCQQPDILGLSQIANKKMAKWLTDSLKNHPNQYPLQYQMWGYLDMVQLLVQLSDYDFMSARQLMDFPLTRCPDLLLQTLSQIRFTKGDALLDQILSALFPAYLSNHTSSMRLIETVWENNDDLVISSICELYKNQNKKENSCLNLSRVLDITQNIRESLIPLTYWNDYGFAVALGILAGKREFLHFEQWIKERLKKIGAPFLNAVLSYVEENLLKYIRDIATKFGMSNPSIPQSFDIALQKAQLSRELLAFIFESALQISGSKYSVRTVENLKRLYKQICQYFPEMSESQMPDQIEILAEKHFHRIYKEEITMDAVVDMMQKLKKSNKQDEKQLYASMITFLFAELRYHSNYPEKELMITANFFSAIINAELIEKSLINVILMILKDDLRFTNKKFDFAITVMDKIRGCLSKQPQFCQALIDNENLMSRNPELVNQLITSLNPPIVLSPEKALTLKTTLDAKLQPKVAPQAPPERPVQAAQTDLDLFDTQDRSKKSQINPEKEKKLIYFLNNLTPDSLMDRHKQLDKLLDSKECIKWVSYHIVFKRITTCNQPNSFEIYVNMLGKVGKLQRPVIKLTYKILEKWFRLTGKSVNDNKLKQFKNLGYWLGRLTIARNEPVLINRLNLKEILINSYQKKVRLLPNVQVIVKILESRKDSQKVFCLRNPWLFPIICILKELNEKVTDNQIKNEVQRLFRVAQINEEEVGDTDDYLSYQMYPNEGKALTISELPNFVQINDEELGGFLTKGVDLRKIIAQSVDAAIQEIVPPVIARSVTIALVTTKQIALKDFALEPDDRKLLKGTHLIVQNLAGSLALVTCREPLKMSLTNFLKKKLDEFQFLSDLDKETIINAASRDNLDLGCALIKKAVIEKALEDINKDHAINEQIERRRQAASKHQVFRNEEYINSSVIDMIPEQLRPRIGGLSDEEFKIYEDFQKDKRSPTFLEKKSDNSKERQDKFMQSIRDNEPVESLRETLQKGTQLNLVEAAQKTQLMLLENKDNMNYYVEILKLLKDSKEGKEVLKAEEMYEHFSEHLIGNKKDFENAVNELCKVGYFPACILQDYLKEHPAQHYKDPQYEAKARAIFDEWLVLGQVMQKFLENLSDHFNKGTQDQIKKFFYFTLKYATEKALDAQSPYCDALDYRYIDGYSKLIMVFLKIVSTNLSVYLEHVCQAILMMINKFHEFDGRAFNQRPFFKLILNLIYDVSRTSYGFDSTTILTMYTVFTHLLHKLQPLSLPGFSFAWLELVSNKYFISTILEQYDFWDLYHELLLDMLRFAQEKLTIEALNADECLRTYYKGILRVVTMLLHDFPQVLSEFAPSLCNQVADRFVQLRNIILSAVPRQLKFTEPQNLQPETSELDSIENSRKLPKFYKLKLDKSFDLPAIIKAEDKFAETKARLQKQPANSVNNFVLSLAWSIYQSQSVRQPDLEEDCSRFLFALLCKCEPATKNALIRGLLNQIRYPNLLTVFFIKFVARALYEETDQQVQTLLVKAIMERMKMEKPHPWGLIFVTNQMKHRKKKLVHLGLAEIADL